jgi:hypothetical protein
MPRKRKLVVACCGPYSQKFLINLLGKSIKPIQIVQRLELLFECSSQHLSLIGPIRNGQHELKFPMIWFGVCKPIACLKKLFDTAPWRYSEVDSDPCGFPDRLEFIEDAPAFYGLFSDVPGIRKNLGADRLDEGLNAERRHDQCCRNGVVAPHRMLPRCVPQ